MSDPQNTPDRPSSTEERWMRVVAQALNDRELRFEFRKWIEAPPKSLWERLSSNTLIQILLGFLLTAVVGSWITNYYAEKQKEIERARTFAEKLNDARVAKIVEVWEKLSLHEAAADRFFQDSIAIERMQKEGLAKKTNPDARALAERTKSDMAAFVRFASEARELSDKNRIWLGETTYHKIREYLAETNARTRAGILESQLSGSDRSRITLAEIRELVFKESQMPHNSTAEPDARKSGARHLP